MANNCQKLIITKFLCMNPYDDKCDGYFSTNEDGKCSSCYIELELSKCCNKKMMEEATIAGSKSV